MHSQIVNEVGIGVCVCVCICDYERMTETCLSMCPSRIAIAVRCLLYLLKGQRLFYPCRHVADLGFGQRRTCLGRTTS